jgi:hypothetical protein
VIGYHIDGKKKLEKNLKSTCEQFIMLVTKITVEPLLSFMTKVTATEFFHSINIVQTHEVQHIGSTWASVFFARIRLYTRRDCTDSHHEAL